MAPRKAKTETVEETEEATAQAPAPKPTVVQSMPASVVPGSSFATRYKARMNTKG